MLTVIVALIACTALCLAFKESRSLGIAGVFALLCIAPFLFGTLFVVAGVVYYVLLKRSRHEFIPKGRTLPPDEASRRRRTLGVLLLVGGTAGMIALAYAPPGEESSYAETIGETAPRIRVPAVYRYHVRLDPEWRVLRRDGVFTVVAPPVRASLPVAIDTAGIEKDVAGTWLLVPLTGDDDIDALERSITAKLARKASSREYLERQREETRATVREFVTAWLIQQRRYADASAGTVVMLFADEPVRSIEALTG